MDYQYTYMKSPPNKLSTAEFISKSIKIHQNKFDYSDVNYINAHIKIKIICPIHGFWEQKPYSHLRGIGCPSCGGSKRKTQEEFIQQCSKITSDYDLSESIYNGSRSKVKIICKYHGEFFITPHDLFSGKGCKKCGKERAALKITQTKDQFLDKAMKIHNNKYTYLLNDSKIRQAKIIIVCPYHGNFAQEPSSHLMGRGCQICAGNKLSTIDIFVMKSAIIHNDKYDYSESNYIGNHIKISIICKKHGKFNQTPAHHLSGSGCPTCTFRVSKAEIIWLNLINVLQDYRQKTIIINKKICNVDAFDPTTNTVYEFYGDYWHGNPKLYKPEDINKRSKVSFGELYNNTMIREKFIKEAGYNLVSIWESDFNLIKGIKINSRYL